ncbi:unnamed protein product [Closterium sp. Yama58-4]|nr:unnamed protein product [Closterium sp. Yama58-4]
MVVFIFPREAGLTRLRSLLMHGWKGKPSSSDVKGSTTCARGSLPRIPAAEKVLGEGGVGGGSFLRAAVLARNVDRQPILKARAEVQVQADVQEKQALEQRLENVELSTADQVAQVQTLFRNLVESRAAEGRLREEVREREAQVQTLFRNLVESRVAEGRLREEVREREAQVQTLSRNLAESRAAEGRLREEVREREAQVQTLSRNLAESRAAEGRLREEVREREAQVQTLSRNLAESRAAEGRLREEVREREAQVQTLSRNLAESRAAEGRLREEVREREAQVQTLSRNLAESRAAEGRLREEVRERDAQVEALFRDLEESRAADGRLREEVREREAQVQALSRDLEESRAADGRLREEVREEAQSREGVGAALGCRAHARSPSGGRHATTGGQPGGTWPAEGYHQHSEPLHMPAKLKALREGKAGKPVDLPLGSRSYEVDRLLGKGAYARVYGARETPAGMADTATESTVALKLHAKPCPWEFYIYRQIHMRIEGPQRQLFGSASAYHEFPDASILACSLGTSGTLQDVVNAFKKQGKPVPEPLCVFYTAQMLRAVEALHAAHILHGDIKPDNFLLRFGADSENPKEMVTAIEAGAPSTGLTLVDYGRSIDMRHFPEGSSFVSDSGPENFQCPQMVEGRPWTTQADLYAVCATAYSLLHGQYMEVERVPAGEGGTTASASGTADADSFADELSAGSEKDKGSYCRPRLQLKRYWNHELWHALFHTYLNVSAGQPAPPPAPIRRRFEQYLADHASDVSVQLCRLRSQL